MPAVRDLNAICMHTIGNGRILPPLRWQVPSVALKFSQFCQFRDEN